MKEYNILNGDCLKEQIKNQYPNLLIMREALMQGPLQKEVNDDFFNKRATFISQEFKACTKKEYLNDIDEFDKIKAIEDNCDINLWFGKDVFCQVNFWFLLNFLKHKKDTNKFYLISPKEDQDCSFSHEDKRVESYENKTLIGKEDFDIFCKLWSLYVDKQYSKIDQEANAIYNKYPFLKETIKAIENMQDLEKEFIKQYKTGTKFKDIFLKICDEYSIYGYGDLQVQYILEK